MSRLSAMCLLKNEMTWRLSHLDKMSNMSLHDIKCFRSCRKNIKNLLKTIHAPGLARQLLKIDLKYVELTGRPDYLNGLESEPSGLSVGDLQTLRAIESGLVDIKKTIRMMPMRVGMSKGVGIEAIVYSTYPDRYVGSCDYDDLDFVVESSNQRIINIMNVNGEPVSQNGDVMYLAVHH